jgi:hypothetical protein
MIYESAQGLVGPPALLPSPGRIIPPAEAEIRPPERKQLERRRKISINTKKQCRQKFPKNL